MNNEIYILGVGRNTPVYIELAENCGYKIAGLYHYNDQRTGEIDHGYPILGSFEELFAKGDLTGMNFGLSQGENDIRAALFNKIIALGGEVPTLIHPSAQVSRFAKIGRGVVIHINAIAHPDTQIGDNSVMSLATMLSHTSSLGKHCYLAGNAIIGAYTDIEDYVFIGMSATTVSSKVPVIGTHSVIGAGALVIKPVDPYSIMVGSPAKKIGETDKTKQ